MELLIGSIIPILAVVVGLVLRTMDKGIALAQGNMRELVSGRFVVIREYRGDQTESFKAFQRDSVIMGAAGYVPTSQFWVPGQWSAGQFLLALLLCLILIGIAIFIYMLIVKPLGALTVTYKLREATSPKHAGAAVA